MSRDELGGTALYVLPPLVIGAVAVRLIFGHPAFWVYLVGFAITGALFGTVRRLLAKHRAKRSCS